MCAQLSSDFGIYAVRVNNGSPARKKEKFANTDAEKWFAFRRLLEKREVILPVDGELLKQLSSRRLQYDAKASIQLEPKESMRSRGLSSPDRADAVIGAAVMSLPGFTGSITKTFVLLPIRLQCNGLEDVLDSLAKTSSSFSGKFTNGQIGRLTFCIPSSRSEEKIVARHRRNPLRL